MKPHRRTTLAAILIGVAVLLPTVAWYITGSREAARQAAALEAQARRQLRNNLEREAERLGNHLESLRAQESERPFFHYQTIYRDRADPLIPDRSCYSEHQRGTSPGSRVWHRPAGARTCCGQAAPRPAHGQDFTLWIRR